MSVPSHLKSAYVACVKDGKQPYDFYDTLSTGDLLTLTELVSAHEEELKKDAEEKSSFTGPKFTNHALARFRERVVAKNLVGGDASEKSEGDWILRWFRKEWNAGRIVRSEMNVTKGRKCMQLLAHNLERTDYFMDVYSNVYVVVGNVVKTVHGNESKRWVRAKR